MDAQQDELRKELEQVMEKFKKCKSLSARKEAKLEQLKKMVQAREKEAADAEVRPA